ncbi:unnamed protein product (macronuclear) [Paramecium tetraurelia]|uniref:Protein kinase domain-containing protein n=1 Tax=Paramecium tetraurelia TaxID=5888 RepID=A0CI06_PARTE|nr:uncharacterized protein GSPATT00038525001 [Paramecium tetraurelia]CAK70423.1 unnamed protein product [Paramecium tetraurelia]|eukprot:XP_001437820.1 hypothetical protein (macronuclear) [Paramecium tetraurelia strain d4-2]
MDYIEYKDAKLQFVGIRKHFFRDKQYYVTVFQEYFTIGSSKDTQSPKYKIYLKLSTKINWNLKKLKDGVILLSFVFPYKNKFKTLCADPLDLLRFKDILNLKVTYEGIGDIYIPLLQIGKGSSAKVYSAQNVINSKVYAIKAIEKSFLNQTDKGSGLEAYNMEVSILKIISAYSSNFLILREIYEGDHTYYLVTEYLEGQSLSEEIERAKGLPDKRLPVQNIKIIIAKLLQSVALLHSHKIIHRDLKPDNMMFAKRNDYFTLVLVDFGLATIETLDKYLFPKCGTPGYVAPEVLTTNVGSKYTTKVDVFSCGCILYKLLTGRSIFNGNSFDEVLRANKKCEIDLKLPMDHHYITEDSINLLNQLLRKDPKLRTSARKALQHPFFDQISEYSTSLQASLLSTIKQHNLNLQIQCDEIMSQYNLDEEVINSEILDQELHQIQLPKLKKCNQMCELQSPQNAMFQFFQKEPLSIVRSNRLVDLASPRGDFFEGILE